MKMSCLVTKPVSFPWKKELKDALYRQKRRAGILINAPHALIHRGSGKSQVL